MVVFQYIEGFARLDIRKVQGSIDHSFAPYGLLSPYTFYLTAAFLSIHPVHLILTKFVHVVGCRSG